MLTSCHVNLDISNSLKFSPHRLQWIIIGKVLYIRKCLLKSSTLFIFTWKYGPQMMLTLFIGNGKNFSFTTNFVFPANIWDKTNFLGCKNGHFGKGFHENQYVLHFFESWTFSLKFPQKFQFPWEFLKEWKVWFCYKKKSVCLGKKM